MGRMISMCEGTCVICGKSFVRGKGKKITCSKECCAERNRIANRERMRELRKSKKFKSDLNKDIRATNKKKPKNNLNKDIKAARELGMSYGEYMANKGKVSANE